jgi:hypothetical protein
MDFYNYKTRGQYTENNVGTYLKIIKNFAQENPDTNLTELTQDDILAFLDKRKKSPNDDPDAKWMTTWNHYRDRLLHIIKWHENYQSGLDEEDWTTPELFLKIKKLNIKRKATHSPHDIWTEEELQTFIKYIPHKRDKLCYALGWDLAGRNHEIVGLKIRDLKLPMEEGHNYALATIPFDSKTGERTNPLIMSYPYLVDWLNVHPLQMVQNAPLITDKSSRSHHGNHLKPAAMWSLFDKCFNTVKKLFDEESIEPEDIPIIRRVLEKPHNPYLVCRHSSITHHTDVLTDQQLKQFAGWTKQSMRIITYVSRSARQVINPLLKAKGMLTEDDMPVINNKTCPICNTVNTPEATLCMKCNYVLSIAKYHEMQEDRKQKEKADSLEKQAMILRMEKMEKMMMEMQQAKANSLLKPQEKE